MSGCLGSRRVRVPAAQRVLRARGVCLAAFTGEFRDPVLNLLGLVDALAAVPNNEEEIVHASYGSGPAPLDLRARAIHFPALAIAARRFRRRFI